jgi:hypothetical protein
MTPVSTTTCAIVDASTTVCVTSEPSSATGTPAVLWHYDAGELVILFVLVAMFAIMVFRGLIHVFE